MDFLNFQTDDSEFSEWVKKFGKRLYGHIRFQVKDDSEAKEVYQITLIKASMKKETYQSKKASVFRWLKIWVRYAVLENHQKKNPKKNSKGESREIIPISQMIKDDDVESYQEILDNLARAEERNILIEYEGIAEISDLLLKELLGGDQPPHQVFSFGFCKLLEWKPREMVEEISNTSFRDLAKRMEEDYIKASLLPDKLLKPSFKLFHDKMEKKFEEVVTEEKTRDIFPHLKDQIIGNTKMNDYYTRKPEEDISHWWLSVKRRLSSFINSKGLDFEF